MTTTGYSFPLLLCTLLAACSNMGSMDKKMASAPAMFSGNILTDAAGMTLYTFDKDATMPGKSVCNGTCATNWPPLMAKEGAMATGDFSVITRDDGKMQWAFKGKPLYYWIKDSKPGDRSGDGVNKIWHVVTP